VHCVQDVVLAQLAQLGRHATQLVPLRKKPDWHVMQAAPADG
jgi:hypothetical protein